MTWSDTFLPVLKDKDFRLIAYVPDDISTPLSTSRGGALDC